MPAWDPSERKTHKNVAAAVFFGEVAVNKNVSSDFFFMFYSEVVPVFFGFFLSLNSVLLVPGYLHVFPKVIGKHKGAVLYLSLHNRPLYCENSLHPSATQLC